MARAPKNDLTRAQSQQYWTGYLYANSREQTTLVAKKKYRKLYAPLPILRQLREDMHKRADLRGHRLGTYIRIKAWPEPDWNDIEFLRGFFDGTIYFRTDNGKWALKHRELRKFAVAIERTLSIPMPQVITVAQYQKRIYLPEQTALFIMKGLWGVPHLGDHWKEYIKWNTKRENSARRER